MVLGDQEMKQMVLGDQEMKQMVLGDRENEADGIIRLGE